MEWLNYHHLLYFWLVAREGGLAPAARKARLAHSTLSTQVHTLEEQLGQKLFQRVGRRLELTDAGRLAYRYAEDIFALGSEMRDALRGRQTDRPLRVDVGVADVVPKLVVARILDPALRLAQPVRLVVHEDAHENLLTRLAGHELHAIVADAPVPTGSAVRAHNHVLGDSGVAFFATAEHQGLRRGFPRSLQGAPMLLPMPGAPLRRALDAWFADLGLTPRIVAEFEDSALLKTVGSEGHGVFPAPAAVANRVRRQFGVQLIGRADDVRERFYLISLERRLRNPAVVALFEQAREHIFRS
ncbi:MAG: transcriptional activator NhaR [Myxococcota bacterium]